MAFMLGSFTQGMFQGMSATMGAMKGIQELKSAWAASDAADAVGKAQAADAAAKKLGNAAAPQAGTTTPSQGTNALVGDRHDSGTSTGTSSTAPKIDLNSVEQPNYLKGLQSLSPSAQSSFGRHLSSEQNGYEAPQADPAEHVPYIGVPSSNEHDNTQPTNQPGTGVPMSATGFGGRPAESALDTGKRLAAGAGDWIRNHLPGAPHSQALDTGEANVPHYLASKPATQQNPVAAAQTGWNALIRPSAGQAVPTQPQQPAPTGMGIGNQQQPLGQQILSAVSPF